MRGWFGPVGKCGCCGGDDPPDPRPCECPEGGLAMSFSGAPVLMLTISGMPESYSWDAEDQYLSGGVNAYWSSFSLSGLDALNGTYAWELPKSESNCIQHPPSFPSGKQFIFKNFLPMEAVHRRLSGSSGCAVQSTDNVNINVFTSLQASIGTSNPLGEDAGRVTTSLVISYSYSSRAQFMIYAQQRLNCGNNYDPSLSLGSTPVGAFPIISSSQRPYSSSEIWIVRGGGNPGRCLSPYDFDYEVVGTMTAEIIDDVP